MKHPRFGFGLGVAILAAACALRLAGNAGAALPASVTDGAKKEGTVVWYATMNTKDMQLTAARFMATHPGIHVETLRAGSSELPARIITEQRGGKYNADVISGDEFQVSQLVLAGALDKYKPAELDRFIKGTYDPNGYWTNLYQNTTVVAWNPDRLKADHLHTPNSTADFARPEWKGKFGIDTGAFNWYIGTLQADEKASATMEKIAANAPVKTSGHTATVVQLESGEFDATPTAYGYLSDEEQRSGKPLAYVNPKPLLVTLNPVGLAKSAPHPNAARVFLEWLLSKAGQGYIAQEGGGEISSRIDVRNNPRIWNPKNAYLIVHAPDSAHYNDAVRAFRAMFGLPG
jgi:iron(III) transport system substrate-binding protein